MCGIVGYIGPRQAAGLLLEGLRRLEYRGYDSSGIAIINGTGLKVTKAAGKLSVLEEELENRMPSGTLGIAHTRWATHGARWRRLAHRAWPGGCARCRAWTRVAASRRAPWRGSRSCPRASRENRLERRSPPASRPQA